MLDETMDKHLQALLHLFLEENKNLNLSAFRNEDDCWNGNVLDSLAALELDIFTHAENGATVLDLGTGGGFPLLPIALAKPEMKHIGLDSTQKKIDAVQRIVDALEIKNVTLFCGRAEELGRDAAHREQYDVVTARGIASLNTLIEYASPFVKPKGKIICWKSMQIDQELQDSLLARAELSCQLVNQHRYTLPDKWGERQLLILEKRGPISDKYPRTIGTPKKHPLI